MVAVKLGGSGNIERWIKMHQTPSDHDMKCCFAQLSAIALRHFSKENGKALHGNLLIAIGRKVDETPQSVKVLRSSGNISLMTQAWKSAVRQRHIRHSS